MGAYEQKLHIRRCVAGDVAQQTEALLLHGVAQRKCRGYIHRKRVYLTPGGLTAICRRYERVSKKKQHLKLKRR